MLKRRCKKYELLQSVPATLSMLVIVLCFLVGSVAPVHAIVNFNITTPTEGAEVDPGDIVLVTVYAWGSVAGIQSISCQGEGDTMDTVTYPPFPPTMTVTEYFYYFVPYSVTPAQELTITVTLLDYVDGLFTKYRHVVVAGTVPTPTPSPTPTTPTPTPTPQLYDIIELVSPNARFGGYFGIAVSGIPDVNGDGLGDVVVGADHEDSGTGPDFAGRAYIFEGDTGNLLQTLVSPNADSYGRFGGAVSGIDDVNGDGRGDVVVGAPDEELSELPMSYGIAYVFSGQTGTLLHTLISPNEIGTAYFGYSVSGVPDVNGDDRGDVIIGAYGESILSPFYDDAGYAYIFNGATGDLISTLQSSNPANFNNFGISVSGIPDVDGDGRGDVVVGSPYEMADSIGSAGKAYVFSGATSDTLHILISPNAQAIGKFGLTVAGTPDLDDDGFGDIMVGAPEESPPRVYIFSGNTGTHIRTIDQPSGDYGNFGSAIAGMDDVTEDNLCETIIGSSWYISTCKVYVNSGGDGSLTYTLSSPNQTDDDQYFGISVSGVPDVNDNGLGDAVVGAYYEDPDDIMNAGRAYIFAFYGPITSVEPDSWQLYE